jgi:hypothetical protein
MAFTRSAVRSRLAPPTFADFGRFGWQAKHDSRAKRAKAAAPKGAGERCEVRLYSPKYGRRALLRWRTTLAQSSTRPNTCLGA